jgi:hypothetical protein
MAAPAQGNAPIGPESEGRKTDPTSGTLMADSGAVPYAGIYRAYIGCSASAAAIFTIQRRNAANDDNTGDTMSKDVGPGAAEFHYTYKLAASERIRVVMGANLTGGASCDVQLEQAS